jgi:lipopolysaccharide/colanic/teichoic acid biosynthesis glycosyltransferase
MVMSTFGGVAKRFFDITFSIIAIIVFAVPMLIIAVLVRIFLGTPILFRQERPGLKGKAFQMLKFRSMTDAIDSNGNLLPDADRMTGFGRVLRSYSLDELPSIWSVLKGDMSLVGPRPLLMEYLDLYSPEQARRHNMRPGITGWAQVNGRNALSWNEKFALDVWYIDNWSMMLDCKILILTATKVLRKENISLSGHATAEKFEGNKS